MSINIVSCVHFFGLYLNREELKTNLLEMYNNKVLNTTCKFNLYNNSCACNYLSIIFNLKLCIETVVVIIVLLDSKSVVVGLSVFMEEQQPFSRDFVYYMICCKFKPMFFLSLVSCLQCHFWSTENRFEHVNLLNVEQQKCCHPNQNLSQCLSGHCWTFKLI